jgi:hypothetical protein
VTAFHTAGPLTDAIIAALSADGLVVGDGIKPLPANAGETPIAGFTDGPDSTFIPYVVVHSMAGGRADGTVGSPNADAWPMYTTISHGATRSQCEQVADRVRAVLLAATFTVAGRQVQHITVDWYPGAARDDEIQPPIWFASERYRLFSTPA